jgi:fatty-acyl-CoA synthase
MQDVPLSLNHLFVRGERLFPSQQIITGGARPTSTTFGRWADRTRRLASALDELGVPADARVATFLWNTAEHLEAYFAVPCSGRILHTINIRMSPTELGYIINHAADDVIITDRGLYELLTPVLHSCPTVRHVLVIGGDATDNIGDGHYTVHDYETLICAAPPNDLAEPADETDAAALCYTSGTTGLPKGVLYSHRSAVLHAFGVQAANGLAISQDDRVLPMVPMYHANAWGLPHAAVGAGAALILPGNDLSAESLADLFESEKVSVASAVPTVWHSLLTTLPGRQTPNLRLLNAGGAAVDPTLSELYFQAMGRGLTQGWGMTEMSPIGAVSRDAGSGYHVEAGPLTVGQPSFAVDIRIVGLDEDCTLQSWDGNAVGELQVRGPWIASGYFRGAAAESPVTTDGWLRTGDLARIDGTGCIYIVDRIKDLIKSGGEWISSLNIESELSKHALVAEVAVVAAPDARWQERPVAFVVLVPGATISAEALLATLADALPRWWVPDGLTFVEQLPKTSVGKIDKKLLKARLSN